MKKLGLYALILGQVCFSGVVWGYAARTTIINNLDRDIAFAWMSNKDALKALSETMKNPDFTFVTVGKQYTERIGHTNDMLVIRYSDCNKYGIPVTREVQYDAGANGYGKNNTLEVNPGQDGSSVVVKPRQK